MKRLLSAILLAGGALAGTSALMTAENRPQSYQPTPEVKASQAEFAEDRFGIFLHWGIYSMFAQGEWYLNYGPTHAEYSKAAGGFYPIAFNADEWVKAIKDAGAKYICFTTRHHDGFSMYDTDASDYNIVDATPFKRDILKELSDACQRHDIKLHLYYSHIDWGRDDYPKGRTGRTTGADTIGCDWPHYYNFMNTQLKELLTNYGPVRCIWFDGWWDHDEDSIPFNWQLDEQYALVHSLQPGCMIGNNHHQEPFEGEDIQIFERDIPGQNTAGLSGQAISRLPLETCNTMNGMWGYKVRDTDYKDTRTLIRYLVNTAGMGANLLLNIGPRPDGRLPEQSLERLKEIGEWMRANGETIYGTTAADFPAQDWGTATMKGKRMFLHVMSPESSVITVPTQFKVKKAKEYVGGKNISFKKDNNGGVILTLERKPDETDYIVELELA
ncbi:MAG: alpha-L-fucosidase [Bacteroidales bacterium]|nr:alpha-L-fucosidase [Bacteroidales bacterium]